VHFFVKAGQTSLRFVAVHGHRLGGADVGHVAPNRRLCALSTHFQRPDGNTAAPVHPAAAKVTTPALAASCAATSAKTTIAAPKCSLRAVSRDALRHPIKAWTFGLLDTAISDRPLQRTPP
jgi:hypothetical protein